MNQTLSNAMTFDKVHIAARMVGHLVSVEIVYLEMDQSALGCQDMLKVEQSSLLAEEFQELSFAADHLHC